MKERTEIFLLGKVEKNQHKLLENTCKHKFYNLFYYRIEYKECFICHYETTAKIPLHIEIF